ncbi:glycosyltransferase family 2 protein [Clostridium celatum]|uniref:glycosyltransferase family 2 protein n=1 Tax=Clostridium celatum TaxID=36834 RepID=UPI00189B5FEB|nr:glycosyltransferase family 2 protein [Clostridium celatum]
MIPLISIIIPVYNAEKYLEQCIDSVLNQSIGNWELILVNDGSKDSSGSICDRYKDIDKRIDVIHISNSGVSHARNVGIRQANSKYVMFVDSDDWIHRDMLKDMLKTIKNTNDQLVVSGVTNVFKDKQIEKNFTKIESISLENNSEGFIELIKDYSIYGPCRKIYIKEIIDKNNICFKKELFFGEDLVFNLQYLEHIKSISIINKSYYYYRMNETSITNTFKVRKPNNINEINIRLNNYIKKHYDENEKIYLIIKERFIKEYLLAITQLMDCEEAVSFRVMYKYLSELGKGKSIYPKLNKFIKNLEYKKRIKCLFYINNPVLWIAYIKLVGR